MKKLMFAVAALAAGATFAEITSANVVGYDSVETVANDYIFAVGTFQGVGANGNATYKLGQLNVGDADFAYWNNDYIATISDIGAQDKYYTWDPDEASWFECDENQVIDYDAPANDLELPMNQALFVFSAMGEALTNSGEVLAGDTELYGLANDTTFTGNCTPAPITLGDIVVGAEDFAYWNNDYIATISSIGAQEQYYTWDPDEESWFECDENEVIDYDAPANSVIIPAHGTFFFFTANGAALNIPSPLPSVN